jgi:glycine cleavage system transcriptional repressor
MPLLAISTIGADRPGIVAAVSRVLLDHGCNLEDTSMSRLHGEFVMMLVVNGPATADALTAALEPVAAELDLLVAVREIDPAAVTAAPARPHIVSVYGADHPGIVHGVAELLARHGVNITDVTTRLLDPHGTPVYLMVLEVDVPEHLEADVLGAELDTLARQLGVDASMHAAEPDIL